jgi:hypothetical protein
MVRRNLKNVVAVPGSGRVGPEPGREGFRGGTLLRRGLIDIRWVLEIPERGG